MLDIKFVRENPDIVKNACLVKGYADNVDAVLTLDQRVRALKTITQERTAEKNKISSGVGASTGDERIAMIAKSKAISAEIADAEAELKEKESVLFGLLLTLPQIPDINSPVGPDSSSNVVTKTVGAPRDMDFTPRAHWDILDMNNWWTPEALAQACGSRTHSLMGEAAELDLAIQNFVIQKLVARGFTYINVPSIVKPETILNAGHFPGADLSVMDNDVFYLNMPDKALSGTGEIILNSLHNDEILAEDVLPMKYAGYSPCFRKEAGAAGRDTRGLIRVHQFHKVEQFIFCKPEQSDEMYALLLDVLEEIMTDLEMPYHLLETSTGDMGFNKIRMTDLEAHFPGQGKYVELGSCSAIGEFQARRTNTRYRENGTGDVKFCATLNNTAMALPRTLAAVIENHQNADGSVNVPKKLQPFMGGRAKIGGVR